MVLWSPTLPQVAGEYRARAGDGVTSGPGTEPSVSGLTMSPPTSCDGHEQGPGIPPARALFGAVAQRTITSRSSPPGPRTTSVDLRFFVTS
jgi:hypothetical protein